MVGGVSDPCRLASVDRRTGRRRPSVSADGAHYRTEVANVDGFRYVNRAACALPGSWCSGLGVGEVQVVLQTPPNSTPPAG